MEGIYSSNTHSALVSAARTERHSVYKGTGCLIKCLDETQR